MAVPGGRFNEEVTPSAFEFHKCISCKHYKGNRVCSAYPEEIPSNIWENTVEHTTVRVGQKGENVYERKVG